jgi:hypothetical protein
MEEYADTPMDFADATLVLLAEALGIEDILTLDRRGFATYRTRNGRPLSSVLGTTRSRVRRYAAHPELVDAGQAVAASPFGPRRRSPTFQWILLAGCDDRSTSQTAARASIRRPTDSIGDSATGINVQNRPGGRVGLTGSPTRP